jgi:hypothetical protein
MLLLFNWLTPLTLITAQQNNSITPDYTSKHPSTAPTKPTQKPFLESLLTARPPLLLDLVNAFADDLYALSLLGILSKRSGDRASRFADWCWWLSTIAGLIENQLERDDIVALRSQGALLFVDRPKLNKHAQWNLDYTTNPSVVLQRNLVVRGPSMKKRNWGGFRLGIIGYRCRGPSWLWIWCFLVSGFFIVLPRG